MTIGKVPAAAVLILAVVSAVLVLMLLNRDTGATPLNSDLVIYSTTDTNVFAPVIEDFRRLHPDVRIRYELLDAQPLHNRVLAENASEVRGADIVLSSAMDLQVHLVNEGLAAPHVSINSNAAPAWTRWRNEAFGVTFEPAVMVFNNEAMHGRRLPQTRQELLRALRSDPEFWDRRVGTYDISKSSVGYLLASQDARRTNEFGVLLEAFGEVHTQMSENTSTLLDDIESGKLAMGYNLLGSYARARVETGAPIKVVYPQDYTLAVSRTAIILKSAPNTEAAHRFVEYLLSLRGQSVLSERSFLSAVRPEIDGPYSRLGLSESQVGLLRPIAIGPGLLVYLDPMKRRSLLDSWNNALSEPETPEK
jgi:iron(III) transport system substrate-binding protein